MKNSLVFIITDETALHDGLLALFSTMPEISTVQTAENSSSGLRLFKNHNPLVMVLDMALEGDGAQKLLKQIKKQKSDVRILALVNCVQQEQSAKLLGAEKCLFKGFSASKIIETTEELLK